MFLLAPANDGPGAAAAAEAGADNPGDAANGGEGSPPAEGGTPPESNPGGAADHGQDQAGAADQQDQPDAWYKTLGQDVQDRLIANGYHRLETAEAALETLLNAETAAQQKLGAKPGDLIPVPKEGQSVQEWMKANAAVLGAVETPEDVGLAPPEELPPGIKWDEGLAKKAADFAVENGVPPALMQGMAGMFMEHQAAEFKATADKDQQIGQQATQQLQQEWGAQTTANQQIAAQGFQWLAQQAGVPADAIAATAQTMTAQLVKNGVEAGAANAFVIKMAHAVGSKLGEDVLTGLTAPGEQGAMTRAEAQAELDEINRQDGSYSKAINMNDREEIKRIQDRIEVLSKVIAAQPK